MINPIAYGKYTCLTKYYIEYIMSKKKVILAMPELFKIHELIIENLEKCGFEVLSLTYEEKEFKYKNVFQRLKKIWYRNILGQKDFKKRTMFRAVEERLNTLLSEHPEQADYCFMIWLGAYPKDFIAKLRAHSKLMVYYNWEALTFLKEDFDNIEFFDKFYFFDPFDQGKHPEYAEKLFPTTSFYFDSFRPSENPQNKILFIGSYAADRNSDIRAFCEAARSIGLEIDFRLASKKIEEEKAALGIPEVEFFSFENALSYRQNLEEAAKSSVLVDFLNRKHYGLSLRIFEAIGLDKKLITTNPTIVHYDFYHPNNMFYWDGSNLEELKAFLTLPYVPLAPGLKHKYSFSNWISCAFDIEPNIPIRLPEINREVVENLNV